MNPSIMDRKIMELKGKEELVDLLTNASVIAENLPRVVDAKVSGDQCVTIIGDTHGDIDTVKKIEQQFFQGQENAAGDRLLFLGDYVDRDLRDIENINYILNLLVEHPDKVILLRGNHEEYVINVDYGFLDNLERQGIGDYYGLYEEVFKCLPLACFLHDMSIFCCHGMTPVEITTIADIKMLERTARLGDFAPIMMQLLWNDPQAENEHSSFPSRRGVGFEVGKQDLDGFMAANGINLIIRSHQAFPEGYRFLFDRKVLSIFSRPNYGINMNDATIARVHGDGRVDVLKASVDDEEFSIIDTLKLEIPGS